MGSVWHNVACTFDNYSEHHCISKLIAKYSMTIPNNHAYRRIEVIILLRVSTNSKHMVNKS